MTLPTRLKVALASLLVATSTHSFAAEPKFSDGAIYMATLHTQQFDKMLDFYANKLELPIASQNGEFVEFKAQGLRLSLASYNTLNSFLTSPHLQASRRGTGVGVGFKLASKAEVDSLYQLLAEREVELVAPPTAQPWGEYTAFFSDPDGNIHELVADLPKQ